MLNAFIYDGLRTPFGRHGGALAALRPDDMLAAVIEALVARNPFAASGYEDVIAGCVTQAGEDNRNVARFAALLAGLPVTVGGLTVNRLCGSGLSAILDAARCVTVGEGALFIAGGVESMSRAPFVIAKSEAPFQRTFEMYDTTIGTRFPNPRIRERYGVESMPETGDNVAATFGIGREASDSFAHGSQHRYAAALERGFYGGEIMGIPVPGGRRSPPVVVDADEHPRPETAREKMAGLPPLFADGTVTAASASGVNDGAAALIVGARGLDAPVRGRILAGAVAGVEPQIMGIGPVHAIPKVLDRAGLTLGEMDVIEINEAFAPQVLACAKLLGLAADDARLNPNGGAIAIGHPLGASGARLALTTLRQLEATGGRYGLVSMCIGVGQGIAMVIERLEN